MPLPVLVKAEVVVVLVVFLSSSFRCSEFFFNGSSSSEEIGLGGSSSFDEKEEDDDVAISVAIFLNMKMIGDGLSFDRIGETVHADGRIRLFVQ